MNTTHDKPGLAFADAEISNALCHGWVICSPINWAPVGDAALQARLYQFAYQRALNQTRAFKQRMPGPSFNPSWN